MGIAGIFTFIPFEYLQVMSKPHASGYAVGSLDRTGLIVVMRTAECLYESLRGIDEKTCDC